MEDEDEEAEAILRKDEEKLDFKETLPSLCSRSMMVDYVARRLMNGDIVAKIDAAKDIRRLVRRSSSPNSKTAVRCRLAAAGFIEPLVSMLHCSFPIAAREAALLALLNLAARHQRNKIRTVRAGAVPSLVDLLKYQEGNVRELAAAAVLSLSSDESNKAAIASSGAVFLLVQVLCSGSVQGRVDAVTALYNLSIGGEEVPKLEIDATAVLPLVDLLKECKKYSKFAEKTTFLLKIFSGSEEGRIAISNADGGILALVETIEDGSSVSMSYAVGALLSLCQSSREKYRDLILKEGAIPGLLCLSAEGTPTAQSRARALLDLLRNSPPKKRFTSSELEKIVYDFATRVDGAEKAPETAKWLFKGMAAKSMELIVNQTEQTKAASLELVNVAKPCEIPLFEGTVL